MVWSVSNSRELWNFCFWPHVRVMSNFTLLTCLCTCLAQVTHTMTKVWLLLTREYLFGFNKSGHCRVRIYYIISAWGSHITTMQSHTRTMQQTHMHKAVTGHVEAKKVTLIEGNQTIVHLHRNCEAFLYLHINVINACM